MANKNLFHSRNIEVFNWNFVRAYIARMEVFMVRKSTFIITICIMLVIFIATIAIIINHYENKNVDISIPTVVEEDSNVESLLPEISN